MIIKPQGFGTLLYDPLGGIMSLGNGYPGVDEKNDVENQGFP
jgi:hypothetical protein